jgi:hypothetical protein
VKTLIKIKFGHDSNVAEAIDTLEAKPDSSARKIPVAEELKAVNSATKLELVFAALSLLEIIRASRKRKTHPGNRHCSGNRRGPHRHHYDACIIQKR